MNKTLRSRCKDVGGKGRQCQHVCAGVCKVCEPMRAAPKVTHATMMDGEHHVGLAGFSSLMANMSKPVVFKGSSVTAHLVAAVGKK